MRVKHDLTLICGVVTEEFKVELQIQHPTYDAKANVYVLISFNLNYLKIRLELRRMRSCFLFSVHSSLHLCLQSFFGGLDRCLKLLFELLGCTCG